MNQVSNIAAFNSFLFQMSPRKKIKLEGKGKAKQREGHITAPCLAK